MYGGRLYYRRKKTPAKKVGVFQCPHKKRYQVSLTENSEFVGRYGLERFMEGQKEKYICPVCGGVISVHDGECSECQEKV